MNKMLVVVFDTEKQAYEGLRALKDLHQSGDLTVYSTAVIVKDIAGSVSVKKPADQAPIGTSLGVITGSLLGLLGGPIGVAIGATTGGLAGVIYDLTEAGVDAEFLADVSNVLTPDRSAVLAEVDEVWVTPADVRLGKLGGHVFRRQRSEMVEELLNREAAALDAELKALETELAQARVENRAALQARIDKTQQQLAALGQRVEAKQAELQKELTAKVEAMREQAKAAGEARKAQVEQRIANLKDEYAARRAKLEQASQLIHEALKPNMPA